MTEWSEQWTLWKRDGSSGVEDGPSTAIDFDRAEKVKVVPKQEAEQKIEEERKSARRIAEQVEIVCHNLANVPASPEAAKRISAEVESLARLSSELQAGEPHHDEEWGTLESERDQALKQGAAEERERLTVEGLFTADEVLATVKAVAKAEQDRNKPEIDRMARIVVERLKAAMDQGDSSGAERLITINRHQFKVRGRTMSASDLYALSKPPLDPDDYDLFQETPGSSPDTWVNPRQIVDFDQGAVFFSVPRRIGASNA